jgi:hypothetical protein
MEPLFNFVELASSVAFFLTSFSFFSINLKKECMRISRSISFVFVLAGKQGIAQQKPPQQYLMVVNPATIFFIDILLSQD